MRTLVPTSSIFGRAALTFCCLALLTSCAGSMRGVEPISGGGGVGEGGRAQTAELEVSSLPGGLASQAELSLVIPSTLLPLARRGASLEDASERRLEYAPFLGLMVPGYTARNNPDDADEAVDQGLFWSIDWTASGDYRHGGSFIVARYFRARRQVFRVVYRYRVAGFLGPEGSAGMVHLWLGLGAFADLPSPRYEDRFGPRPEVSVSVGRVGRPALLMSVGWEPSFPAGLHHIELAISAFIPFVF